jgi:hypothetical protein
LKNAWRYFDMDKSDCTTEEEEYEYQKWLAEQPEDYQS